MGLNEHFSAIWLEILALIGLNMILRSLDPQKCSLATDYSDAKTLRSVQRIGIRVLCLFCVHLGWLPLIVVLTVPTQRKSARTVAYESKKPQILLFIVGSSRPIPEAALCHLLSWYVLRDLDRKVEIRSECT